MAMQTAPNNKLDRQTVVPFHLKLFYRSGGFPSLSDISQSSSSSPNAPLPPHLQIYTWPTCTLRELSHLLVSALPSVLPSPAIGTRLAYRLVYPDPHTSSSASSYPSQGRYLSRELGDIVISAPPSPDENEGHLERETKINGTGTHEEADAGPAGDVEGRPNGEPQDTILLGDLGGQPDKTLQEARFIIGDYVAVAIMPPRADGSIAALPPPPSSSAHTSSTGPRGPPRTGGPPPRERENGYGYGSYGYGGRSGGSGRLGPPPGDYGGPLAGGGRFSGDAAERDWDRDRGVPSGEWHRGERVPERYGGRGGGGGGGGGFGRGRGRSGGY